MSKKRKLKKQAVLLDVLADACLRNQAKAGTYGAAHRLANRIEAAEVAQQLTPSERDKLWDEVFALSLNDDWATIEKKLRNTCHEALDTVTRGSENVEFREAAAAIMVRGLLSYCASQGLRVGPALTVALE